MFDSLKHIASANRILRRIPLVYRHAMRALKAVDAMNYEQRRDYQDKQISKVLQQAKTLPGYASAPDSLSLDDWPILPKQNLLGREHMYETASKLPTPSATTGGTTGQPLKLKRGYYNVVFEQCAVDYICQQAGIAPRSARTAILRGDSIKLPQQEQNIFWIDEGGKKRIYSAHHMTRESGPTYVQSLREYAPDILFCYPSSLAALLAYVGSTDGLHIPLVFASSEILHPETIALARKRLGCDIVDLYGHAERVALAYSMNGDAYHFLPAYGHVELIPCGTGKARIIATSLRPNGQLFVRYETGDIALTGDLPPGELPRVALGLAPFQGIDGRDSEFIALEDGRRIIGLNHIPRGVKGVANVQLHHSAPEVVDIYIVPEHTFGAHSRRAILDNFYAKFPSYVNAKLWLVEAPVREPNGKAPLYLRNPQIPETARLCLGHAYPIQAA